MPVEVRELLFCSKLGFSHLLLYTSIKILFLFNFLFFNVDKIL